MALGKKTQPNGSFEIGDLLYADKPNEVYYKSASFAAAQIVINSEDRLLGVIHDNDVDGETENDAGTWLSVILDGTANTKVFVQLDSSKFTAKANPEYNYPEKSTSGSGKTWNWENILIGIGTVTNSILGIFNNSKKEVNPAITPETDPEAKTETGALAWLKKNLLLVIVVPIGAVLAFLVIKFVINLFKSKTPPPPAPQAPMAPTAPQYSPSKTKR